MNALLYSRVDTTQLYPRFFVRLQAVIDELAAAGKDYWLIEGFRTPERSDELYAQGRSAPGPIVTQARRYESAHNYGIAGDVVLDGYIDRAGLQPDWRPASYDALGPVAAKHGLLWGGTWVFKDRPHLQLPGFAAAAELAPLRAVLQSGGLQAVWAYLDTVVPA